jgi:hypothetical protein
MYRLPRAYDDGMIISCRSYEEDSCLCFKSLIDKGRKFDVVFVDSFHTYESSKRDLELALLVLDKNGTLVVHDCDPPSIEYTLPESMNGNWTGETYLAFLDFITEKKYINHCVIDMDWGCGVIRWNNADAVNENKANMLSTTCRKKNDDATRPLYYQWEYFREHRTGLLNLKSVTEFTKSYQMQEE